MCRGCRVARRRHRLHDPPSERACGMTKSAAAAFAAVTVATRLASSMLDVCGSRPMRTLVRAIDSLAVDRCRDRSRSIGLLNADARSHRARRRPPPRWSIDATRDRSGGRRVPGFFRPLHLPREVKETLPPSLQQIGEPAGQDLAEDALGFGRCSCRGGGVRCHAWGPWGRGSVDRVHDDAIDEPRKRLKSGVRDCCKLQVLCPLQRSRSCPGRDGATPPPSVAECRRTEQRLDSPLLAVKWPG